jgi:hypothetical protein
VNEYRTRQRQGIDSVECIVREQQALLLADFEGLQAMPARTVPGGPLDMDGMPVAWRLVRGPDSFHNSRGDRALE